MPELTNLFVFSNGVVRRNYRFLRVIFLILFLYKRLMNPNFKSNERELVKIAGFFKRQSRKLIDAGKLDKEHEQVGEAVDRFIATIEDHANVRARILDDRQTLRKLVRDNAVCPRCHTGDKLKLTGTEKDSKGRVSNRYKCRKCNIQFTWNRPNNPWDMVRYIEEVMETMREQRESGSLTTEEADHLSRALESMQANLNALKPVIDSHDEEYNRICERDQEMEKVIHEFKNSLLIEKIKMDTWDNRDVNRT